MLGNSVPSCKEPLPDSALTYDSDQSKPGDGYEDAIKAFHKSTEEDREMGRPLPDHIQPRSVTAKILSDRLAEQNGYTDTKGLLLDLFMEHKPTWVNSIIVIDDKLSVIDSIERFKTETHHDLAITAIHVSSQHMDYAGPIRAHLDSKLITVENYRKFAQDYIDNSFTRLPNDAVAIKKRLIVNAALNKLNNVDNDAVIRINEFRLKLQESLDDVSLSMRNDSTFMYLLKCVGVVLSGGLAYSVLFGKESTKGGKLLKEVEADKESMVDTTIQQPAIVSPEPSKSPSSANDKLPNFLFIADSSANYGREESEAKKKNREQCETIKALLLQFSDVTENNFRESKYHDGTIFETEGTSFEIHSCASSKTGYFGSVLVAKDKPEIPLITTLPTFYGRSINGGHHDVTWDEGAILEAIERTTPRFQI